MYTTAGSTLGHLVYTYIQICVWYAKIYGQRDESYHEAYNDELYRQAQQVPNIEE